MYIFTIHSIKQILAFGTFAVLRTYARHVIGTLEIFCKLSYYKKWLT